MGGINNSFDPNDSYLQRSLMTADGTPVNNSTTRVNQDLSIVLPALEKALVEIVFLATVSSVSHMRFGLAYPTGCDIKWGTHYGNLAQYDQSGILAAAEENGTAYALVCPDGIIIGKITAIVQNGATAGTLTLMMAQRIAEVFDSKLLAGSCLIKMRLN